MAFSDDFDSLQELANTVATIFMFQRLHYPLGPLVVGLMLYIGYFFTSALSKFLTHGSVSKPSIFAELITPSIEKF